METIIMGYIGAQMLVAKSQDLQQLGANPCCRKLRGESRNKEAYKPFLAKPLNPKPYIPLSPRARKWKALQHRLRWAVQEGWNLRWSDEGSRADPSELAANSRVI